MSEEQKVEADLSEGIDAPAVVFEVPAGKKISVGAPNLIVLANGRLLVAFDQMGPDVKKLHGKKGHNSKRNRWMQGCVMSSSDGGSSWQRVATYPFRRASLFRDGGDVYLLGEASGGLSLMRSPDGGTSWSSPMELTSDLDLWLSPTTVRAEGDTWVIPCLVPAEGGMGLTVWKAPRGASLMNRKAWTQGPVSPPLSKWVGSSPSAGCGVPQGGMAPAWRDPVLFRIADSQHPWHTDGVLHMVASTRSGRQHWASVMRLNLQDFSWSAQQTPEETPWIWIPCPGGHEKFELMMDESHHRFWLMGCCGVSGLPLGRSVSQEAGLHRIGLWSSDNLVDWQTAGKITVGEDGPEGIRCDPAAALSGKDLFWVCRAGGEGSRNARETRRILCGSVRGFRSKTI